MIDSHYQETIRQLLRLYKNTPRCVLFFLAGTLPGAALIHIRQLNLFGMICRLGQHSLLYQHAKNFLTSVVCFKGSWFHQIRKWCLLYHLAHPSDLFEHPPPKEEFKRMVKKSVIQYWENVLRNEANNLKSLVFFKPQFMSLVNPHPLWKTAGHNPIQVSMATVQASLLSGRYRCGALLRHWSSARETGYCKLSLSCSQVLEDVPHIIRWCPSLANVRHGLLDYTYRYSSNLPIELMSLIRSKCTPSSPTFVDFILDCSTDPNVIKITQELGPDVLVHFFAVTRTWAFVIHRERSKMLRSWRATSY